VKDKTGRPFLLVFLAVVVCGQAFGLHQVVPSQHVHRASKRRSHFRRMLWNPVFRPSRDSLLRQNEEIDRLELPRIQNQAELDQLIARQELVPIVASETLRFDPRLDPDRRYCRPWTRDFLDDLSEAYYERFHGPIQVNSAVRTVQVQKRLRRHNRNAAPEKGETASSHLAGITVDIQRRGMSKQQVAWMEQYLMPLRIRVWWNRKRNAISGCSTSRSLVVTRTCASRRIQPMRRERTATVSRKMCICWTRAT